MVHRDRVEAGQAGDDRASLVVTSQITDLEIGNGRGESRVRPETGTETSKLFVTARGDGHSLDVTPVTPIFRNKDDRARVEWDFGRIENIGDFYPLILFYQFRPSSKSRSTKLEARKPFSPLGPFHRMTYSPRSVIGERVPGEPFPDDGSYHYEAALLSSRHRNVAFVSSGDPSIDNEGGGFQRPKL